MAKTFFKKIVNIRYSYNRFLENDLKNSRKKKLQNIGKKKLIFTQIH